MRQYLALFFSGIVLSITNAANTTTHTTTLNAASPQIKASYLIENYDTSPNLVITLNVTNYTTTAWTSTDGTKGMWLGLGFGNTRMVKTDIVRCVYQHKALVTDTFVCQDGYNPDYNCPIFNEA